MKKNSEPASPPAPRPRTYLTRWQCAECQTTRCGWITEFDNEPRICHGIPRIGPSGDLCNALMRCVYTERPRTYAPSYHDQVRRSSGDFEDAL